MSDPKPGVVLDILRRLLRDERVREAEPYTVLERALVQTGQISEEGAAEELEAWFLGQLRQEVLRTTIPRETREVIARCGEMEEGDVFAVLEEELVRFDEELADSMAQDIPTVRPAEGWLRSGIQSGAIGVVADREGYAQEALLLYRRAILSFGSALGVDLRSLVHPPAPTNEGKGGEVIPFRRPDRG
jgi:hypothetical protein